MRRYVWVGDDEPQRWLRNGSYLVSRRIRMRIEAWDRDTLADQERVIGRFKQSGAPLTGSAGVRPRRPRPRGTPTARR